MDGHRVMNRPAVVALLLIGGGLLLIGGARSGGQVEGGGDSLSNWNTDALMDNISGIFNRAQDAVSATVAPVAVDAAAANCAAWIDTIGKAEGADYSTCYGYSFTITDYSDHPAVLGTWPGVKLSDTMCANAGFGPGCISTAAGKGQITRPTWLRLKAKLGLPDFSPASQDAAILQLTAERGALEAVKAGDVATAAQRCRNEWASLPGNYAGQGQRSATQLAQWFAAAGGQAVTA
jgi:muramidase (phage lysozyme)